MTEALAAKVDFPVPDSLVESETQSVLRQFIEENMRRGVPQEQFEKDKKELFEGAKKAAHESREDAAHPREDRGEGENSRSPNDDIEQLPLSRSDALGPEAGQAGEDARARIASSSARCSNRSFSTRRLIFWCPRLRSRPSSQRLERSNLIPTPRELLRPHRLRKYRPRRAVDGHLFAAC